MRRKLLALALLLPLAARAADPRVIELAIKGGKPEGGVRTVRVAKGEAIALRVHSDEAIDVHVHGYDVKIRAQANATASVRLNAAIVGRFPVTAHGAQEGGKKAHEPTLLYLEVHPK